MLMNSPHGGPLRNLLVDEERASVLKQKATHLPSWDLTPSQVCDVEMLLNGAFSPLEGFLCKADHTSVCETMRLADGTLWPMPVTLDVTTEFASSLGEGSCVVLRHPEGMILAILTVNDIWERDLQQEAEQVFGTTDESHPSVFNLLHQTNPACVGGALEGLEIPLHHTFKHLRHTPAELRAEFDRLGWEKVVAFQTHEPLHRAEVALTRKAAAKAEANILLHPVVGLADDGDVDYFARVRCYQAVLEQYPDQAVALNLLPLAVRWAGPRSALWHALIQKNYGCGHFILGPDLAGPETDDRGKPFYASDATRNLAEQYQEELGIEILHTEEMVYVEDLEQYVAQSEVPKGASALPLSQSEVRRRLREDVELPEWFSFPDVIAQLRRSYPPRSQQGFTVFFTGLSGAGKSTIAKALLARLMEIGSRPVTLLDGDIVRKNLSSELGFSKEHRDINIRRIGFVASEITKNRGIAICAPIAPYDHVRRQVHAMIDQYGGFVLVHVSTPLEVCEARDRKGLYAKARAGLIKEFTGISDPYEPPENAEVVADASILSADESVQKIISHLEQAGYISPESL